MRGVGHAKDEPWDRVAQRKKLARVSALGFRLRRTRLDGVGGAQLRDGRHIGRLRTPRVMRALRGPVPTTNHSGVSLYPRRATRSRSGGAV
jgi:hypothetical protein